MIEAKILEDSIKQKQEIRQVPLQVLISMSAASKACQLQVIDVSRRLYQAEAGDPACASLSPTSV